MDRGAWRATVHGATKSWTRLKYAGTQGVAKIPEITLLEIIPLV